MIFKTEWCGKS